MKKQLRATNVPHSPKSGSQGGVLLSKMGQAGARHNDRVRATVHNVRIAKGHVYFCNVSQVQIHETLAEGDGLSPTAWELSLKGHRRRYWPDGYGILRNH